MRWLGSDGVESCLIVRRIGGVGPTQVRIKSDSSPTVRGPFFFAINGSESSLDIRRG